MSISISDLFTPLTAAQFRAKMVAELIVLGIPADKWIAGGVASSLLTVASIMLALTSTLVSTTIKGFFLPTATGDGLKALAFYVYGVDVPDASFATGVVTLTNSGGGIYPYVAGAYFAKNPTTGQTYTNSANFSLGANATLDVPMRAVNVGSIANSVPGSVTVNVTSLTGVTVTNAAAFVGVDSPTDDAIRSLCLNRLASLSVRGVRNVYAYAIQTAINPITMGPVNINRWTISESSHYGTVTMYVAAPSGAPDANDLTGIRTRVEAVARPSGVEVDVLGATEAAYSPTIAAYVRVPAGVLQATVKDAVDAAVLTYITAYPIGGVTAADDAHSSFTGLFGDGIVGAIAQGVTSVGGTLLSVRGASDLALTVAQVATDDVAVGVILVSATSGVIG